MINPIKFFLNSMNLTSFCIVNRCYVIITIITNAAHIEFKIFTNNFAIEKNQIKTKQNLSKTMITHKHASNIINKKNSIKLN